MVDCCLAALEKQQIFTKVNESAYNESCFKVNVNQSCCLFVWGALLEGDSLHTLSN